MLVSPIAVTAMPALPVLMLVGGMAVLAVGLVLLTRGRERGGVAAPAPRATLSAWTAATPPSRHDAQDAPDCDWAAWWDTGDGPRLSLRHPVGRACCHYVVGVRELDPIHPPLDELDDALGWAGADTRITTGGATTPTAREVVGRQAATRAHGLQAGVSLERTPGPVVTTPGWRDQPGDDELAAGTPASRAAQLWSRHIDSLRDHGARPVPADGPRVAPLERRRRVELHIRVERGCATAPHRASVDAEVRAHLSGAATPGLARMGAPTLGSWVGVGGDVIAADIPTTPPTGLAAWSPAATETSVGVQVTADPSSTTCEAAWSGRWVGDVDESALVVVVGSAVALELDVGTNLRVPVSAQLVATTTTRVDVEVGEATPGAATSGCTRCLPAFAIHLGDEGGSDVSPATATADGTIRLGGRVLHMAAPPPDGPDRSWTVESHRPVRPPVSASSSRTPE